MISPAPSVDQLFKAACECSPLDRAAFLEHACRHSPMMRRLVEEKLRENGYLEADPSEIVTQIFPHDDIRHGEVASVTEACYSPGQTIAGRFKIVRYIARGGMGEVYEVEDRFLQGVHVALKLIRPEIAGDRNASHRFEQEVLLARKVTHPNLCPIYDIARSEDESSPALFLTMKLIHGETLASRLGGVTRIQPEEAVGIFLQILGGLAAIHSAGVIHRDIKPNNIMLDSSGPQLCVSIMDFGIACLYEPEVTMLTRSLVVGTPGYMAPEILQGEGPSQASDLFAFGVVIHEVLTGSRPKVGSHGLNVESSPDLDKSGVPPVFIHTVKEFLSTDKMRRYRAFEEIQDTLGHAPASLDRTFRKARGAAANVSSRRRFLFGSTLLSLATVGGITWRWNELRNYLNPLPVKRFVALLGWPSTDDAKVESTVDSIIDSIGAELIRAEAFDRNLLIIPHGSGKRVTTPAQLNELRETLGANLIFATSGSIRTDVIHLLFRVLDPATMHTLREKALKVPFDHLIFSSEKAIKIAAELLNITSYKPQTQHSIAGTSDSAAYADFQSAESSMKEENDKGLNNAIEKYRQAIDKDPSYAIAQARLSWAYLRLYGLRGDAAALALASANSQSAIRLDPSLVDAHVGLAWAYQQTGDEGKASEEMSKAITLDPNNPHTLIYQAHLFAAGDKWDPAKQVFARVLQLRPNYWLAHQELGVILDLQGNYREALIQFRAASLASPKNALAIKNVGSVYLQLGELGEALNALTKSFQLNPDDTAAVALASVMRLKHNYGEAIHYADLATKLNPSEPVNWLELGDSYSARPGLHKEAISAYRRAVTSQEETLRTSPNDGPGWMLLALCRAKAGELATAETLIAKAESLHADDMDSQLIKVRTFALLGRTEDALATIERCLNRGDTRFQLESMPDLGPIRKNPRYQRLFDSTVAG